MRERSGIRTDKERGERGLSGERPQSSELGDKYKKKERLSWEGLLRNIFSNAKEVVKFFLETPLIAASLVIAACIILGCICMILIAMPARGRQRHSDTEALHRARLEMDRWAKGQGLPTFGITHGNYLRNGKFCYNCGAKEKVRWCRGRATNTTFPPRELLAPGRLAEREISDTAGCFLWYAHQLFSRPAGGAAGIWTLRMGGGVDNRTRFLEALRRCAARLTRRLPPAVVRILP